VPGPVYISDRIVTRAAGATLTIFEDLLWMDELTTLPWTARWGATSCGSRPIRGLRPSYLSRMDER
jgi:hypothetical protein